MNFRELQDNNLCHQSHDGLWRVSEARTRFGSRFSLFERQEESQNPYEKYGWKWIRNFDSRGEAEGAARQIANDRAVEVKDYAETPRKTPQNQF